MIKVYLGSPFFSPEQLATVQKLENTLRAIPRVELYSPRQDGIILKDLPPAQRLAACHTVFKTNVDRINWCDCILANIDGRDTGTVWEMGYGYGKGKRIITYTSHDYGLNVMLQCCVVAHLRSLDEVHRVFEEGATDEICKDYRAFHAEVT